MAQHRDPSFRPGRGHTATYITLTDDAERALEIWSRIYGDRCEEATGKTVTPSVPRDAIDHVLSEEAGTVAGHLLLTAVTDADTRPAVALGMPLLVEKWAAIAMLDETSRTLAPPVALAVEDSTTCRHGVPFTDDCQTCDDEMGD